MSTNELVGKYIGPNKIVSAEEAGNGFVKVVVERISKDASIFLTKYLHQDGIAVSISDESIDYTKDFQNRANKIAEEVAGVFTKYNIDYTELDLLMQTIKQHITLRFDRAVSKKLFGDDSVFVPGWNPLNDMSLAHAEMINKESDAAQQG